MSRVDSESNPYNYKPKSLLPVGPNALNPKEHPRAGSIRLLKNAGFE